MAQGTKSFTGAGQTHQFKPHGAREAQVDVTGVFVGTVVAEWSADGGTTWNTLPMLKSDGTIVQSLTVIGSYILFFIPMNATDVRTRCSAFTSGSPVTALTLR